MRNIILFGSPGAGKGTLIELLAEKGIQFSLVNPGQMLRDLSKDDSDLAKKIRETMASGGLVDDFLVTELVKKKMRELKNDKPVIFDGYPRSFGQVEKVDSIFAENEFDLPYLVFVKISKEEAVKRLSSRRVCSVCKENFQVFELKNPDVCPKCGGKLIQRDDDKPESIETRFELFDMQFKIIEHYFKSKDRYFEIDGTIPKPERVQKLIEIIQS